jgi:hypothetical protein
MAALRVDMSQSTLQHVFAMSSPGLLAQPMLAEQTQMPRLYLSRTQRHFANVNFGLGSPPVTIYQDSAPASSANLSASCLRYCPTPLIKWLEQISGLYAQSHCIRGRNKLPTLCAHFNQPSAKGAIHAPSWTLGIYQVSQNI